MKKITYLALCLGFSLAANGQQTTVDFESLNLTTAESYNDGSDGSGGFNTQNVFFFNDYQGYWSGGFAYSNMTDVTTAGFLNQYSVYAGSGANNSSNYGLFTTFGYLTFSQGVALDSVKICNTTYAALSMKNGDSFAKQFGSPNNASGTPDGTNGEDFFLLRIYSLDAASATVDSLDFYLADFRFSDNTQDYIIEDWTNLDLSPLGTVNGLAFKLKSSDVGAFGMNTPNYFALDNLTFKSTLGVQDLHSDLVKTYPNPVQDLLTINWNGEADIALYDVSGTLVASGKHKNSSILNIEALAAGVYELKVSATGQVFSEKIVK